MRDAGGRSLESERQLHGKSCALKYTDILINATLNDAKFASGYGHFINGKLVSVERVGIWYQVAAIHFYIPCHIRANRQWPLMLG